MILRSLAEGRLAPGVTREQNRSPEVWPLRLRQIAPIALVLGLTLAGFIVARVLAEHGARRDSEHRAEVAVAQVRGRVAQAASLTESLRRFMVNAGGTGVTSSQFSTNAFWWLGPAGLTAAAWVERVPASRRRAYEQRVGRPIVSPDAQYRAVPTGSRSSHLPATLVSGFPPMSVAGLDLSGEHVRRAVRAGVTLVCSTDAHSVRGLGNMVLSVATARRGWASAADVLNTRPLDEVLRR